MGIELPVELLELAEQVGARWPEADEDVMRRSATAWRDAASSLRVLAGQADSTAQGALAAIDGATADAARRRWDGFVDPTAGHLPVSVTECTAAADRLDHAAERIGEAKVRIVRELVVLARNRDAAQQAAAAGNPRALAGIDTLVRGTTASLAEVHQALAGSVEVSQRSLTGAAAGVPATGSSVVDSAADSAGSAASDLVEPVRPVADPEQAVDVVARSADAGLDVATEAGPGSGVGGSTGPLPSDVASGTAQRSPETSADAGTGPIPRVVGDAAAGEGAPAVGRQGATSNQGGVSPEIAGPASDTAPQAVHQAWAAAPPASAGGMAPVPPPVSHGSPGYGQAGPVAAPAAGPVGGAPRAASGPPPVAGARPPGASAYGPPAGSPPRPTFRPGPPQPGSPVPAPVPPPAHAAPPVDGPPRPPRQPERSSAVVAFVLHQFPLGHMPVAASRPSLQWSTPRPDDDTDCLRFPPQDHPRAALVTDTDALVRARSGLAGAGSCPETPEQPVPNRLLDHYDPLGDPEHEAPGEAGTDGPAVSDETPSPSESPLPSEAQWERRYLVRAGTETQRSEYLWPAWSGHPEGGAEVGDPVVLEPGTVVDRVGGPEGRILSADGTMFAQRSLPPEHRERGYRRYRVLRPLPVRQAVTAPWFGQPGGGMRYRTTYPVGELVELGYLVELLGGGTETAAENAQAMTLRLAVKEAATTDVGNTEQEAQ